MFKKTPNIITVQSVVDANANTANVNGKWVPARPEGYWSWAYRFKAAWKVFTGNADALTWEGQ